MSDVEYLQAYNNRRWQLLHAIKTRPLSYEELRQVGELGTQLVIEPNQSYTEEGALLTLSNLLALQSLIRVAAREETT